jgi:hypothetical protein
MVSIWTRKGASMREFIRSLADFSWALTVFAVSQSAKVVNGLPTSDPTKTARKSFNATTTTMKEQFDAIDNTAFNTGKTVQDAVIDLTFNFFTPNTFNPITIWNTSQNVLRWGVGIATQFIPGGQVGVGGPPTGWGPVNREEAELFRQ